MYYIGAARKCFENGVTAFFASWITPEEIKMHDSIFGSSEGGYNPPLNWYKA